MMVMECKIGGAQVRFFDDALDTDQKRRDEMIGDYTLQIYENSAMDEEPA